MLKSLVSAMKTLGHHSSHTCKARVYYKISGCYRYQPLNIDAMIILQTHYVPRSVQTYIKLNQYNLYLGTLLWIPLLSLVLVLSVFNLSIILYSRLKLSTTDHDLAFPTRKINHIGPFIQSLYRKYLLRKTSLTHTLHLKSNLQLILILSYFGYNILLILLKTKWDIDWLAHHAARMVFANLPLVIGLASKNNLVRFLNHDDGH